MTDEARRWSSSLLMRQSIMAVLCVQLALGVVFAVLVAREGTSQGLWLPLRNASFWWLVSSALHALLALAWVGLGVGLARTVSALRRSWWARLVWSVSVASALLPATLLRLRDTALQESLPLRERTVVFVLVGVGCTLVAFAGHALATSRRWKLAWPSPRTLLGFHGAGLILFLVALVLDARGAAHTGTVSTETGSRPNLLLIVVDALRRDALGAYGSPLGNSPHLDGLAAEGVVLDGIVANGPTSIPGHASLLTGLGVEQHHAATNAHRLPEGIPTLAGKLRGRGYRTVGICRNQLISPAAGFDQGFDFYWCSGVRRLADAPLPVVFYQIPVVALVLETIDADLTTLYGQSFLRRDPRPWFLFLQYLYCHDPYQDRLGWADASRREAVLALYENGTWVNRTSHTDGEVARFHARYLGSVYFVDDIIGSILHRLDRGGMLDETVVVVTSDHGENLAEHGDALIGHHVGPFNTSLRIPLIARVPGSPVAGVRFDALTGQDRVEELLLLASDPTSPLYGPVAADSLGAWLAKPHHLVVVDDGFVLFGDRWKVVVGRDLAPSSLRVFDWRADEFDETPLEPPPASALEMMSTLAELLEISGLGRSLESEITLTEEQRRALEALGYLD